MPINTVNLLQVIAGCFCYCTSPLANHRQFRYTSVSMYSMNAPTCWTLNLTMFGLNRNTGASFVARTQPNQCHNHNSVSYRTPSNQSGTLFPTLVEQSLCSDWIFAKASYFHRAHQLRRCALRQSLARGYLVMLKSMCWKELCAGWLIEFPRIYHEICKNVFKLKILAHLLEIRYPLTV